MQIRWIRLLLDPQAGELGGGGGGATGQTAVTSEDPAAFDDTNAPSVTDDPGVTDNTPVTVTPTTTPVTAQPNWQSIRDVAKASGYNVAEQFQDDGAFLTHLLTQANQARATDFHARLGQQLAPHASRIQTFLQQQQAPPVVEEAKPWEAPEFDERWMSLVERDPASGVYIAKPGADPSYAQKVNAFAKWKEGYDRNPAAVLNGLVEARAKKIADDQFNARFAERERESTVRSIVSQNSEWLYQRDQAGNAARDYAGQPMLTPVGARYMHHLASVKQMGVTDPRAQDTLAKQLVQGEHYASQAQAANPQNPQTRAATNSPNINPLQTQPPGQRRTNPAATEPKTTGLSLSEMLRQELAAEGVTDTDISNSIGH